MTDQFENLGTNFPGGFSAFLLHDHELASQLPYPVTQAKKQVHGDQSIFVTDENNKDDFEADAFISNLPGHFVGVRMADCGAILLADPITGYYAAVHSGWKGTKAEIVPRTLAKLRREFGVDPQNLMVWMGPLACGKDYEVGQEFKEYFAADYLTEKNGKLYLDFGLAIYDQLVDADVKKENIVRDLRCTLTDQNLPSARRQGKATGKRMLAVITRSN